MTGTIWYLTELKTKSNHKDAESLTALSVLFFLFFLIGERINQFFDNCLFDVDIKAQRANKCKQLQIFLIFLRCILISPGRFLPEIFDILLN